MSAGRCKRRRAAWGLVLLALGLAGAPAGAPAGTRQAEPPDIEELFIDDEETRRIESDTRRLLGADFRVVRTRHYLLRTDCGADYARAAALDLEAMFRGFHDVFAAELDLELEESAERADFAVYLFEKEEGFRLYKHAHLPDAHDAQGFYDPRSNQVLLYREFQAGEEVTGIKLLHEAAHQLLHQSAGLVPTVESRVWLLEGLACYFETARFGADGRPSFGSVHPNRLKVVERSLERSDWTAVAQIVRLRQRSFVGGGGELGNLHYAEAWSLVHYLLHGAEGTWRERFFEFVRRATRGEADEERFREVFGDPLVVEEGWRAYVRALAAGG